MVGSELFVLEINAFERDGLDLFMANGKPSEAAADKEAVDAGRMDKRNDGGVFDGA